MTRPGAELEREDLELEVGGARLAARRLRPGAAAAAAPTLVFLHEGLGCIDAWSITGELSAVTCPALLLRGVEDEYASPGHLTEIAARLGGPVRAELLAGCGHAPHHEVPDVVIDLVVQWISSWMPSEPAPRQDLRGGA